MATELAELKNFPLENSRAIIWTFKKSASADIPPKPIFTGKWIPSDKALSDALVLAFKNARNRVEESFDYSILEQNNEASVLIIETNLTNAPGIIAGISEELPSKKIKKTKELHNSSFYIIKIISGNRAVYCFKRCDGSWSAKKSSGTLQAIYKDDTLTLEIEPKFNISQNFDFYVLDETIFVAEKKSFESVLSYKQGHVNDFASLCEEPEFNSVFSHVDAITQYVGSNAMQLRRISAIKEKGHYKNPGFLASLKLNYVAYGLHIEYDEHGRIVPTIETCPSIFQALLDHRLKSHYETLYDVQSAIAVANR